MTVPRITAVSRNSQKMRGICISVALPICANPLSIFPTLAPPVTAIPIPWNSVMVPSVAMRGGAEVLEMSTPFSSPNSRLTITAAATAATILAEPVRPNAHCPLRIYALVMATVFALAIMDRSIPPIILDSIIAKAKNPNSGIWNVIDCIFFREYIASPKDTADHSSTSTVTPVRILRFKSLRIIIFTLFIFCLPIL